MEYRDRDGNAIHANDGQDRFLERLYGSTLGRMALKPLISPAISQAGGWLLDHPISRAAIAPFVKNNHIDLKDYEEQEYASYNAFFHRQIKGDKRPVNQEKDIFISPCDSKLSAYPITENGKFLVKHTPYTMESLLQNRKLAERFYGGQIMIFRLTVDDYHHYCYVDDGAKSGNIHIPGVFHTVNPIANDVYPIYKENTREYSLLKSEHFGTILMMEVGALMVGKITNLHGKTRVQKGQEKGYFEFGGSTVILCVQKDQLELDEDIRMNTADGVETIVKMGEQIGKLSKKTGKNN
ncbi:MAG: phosphatidylserine decarboxylase [Lachnospiraceae bacterium]|nr:phosphatidylserine decarboxylase [Lachnospiraceae bacterium]